MKFKKLLKTAVLLSIFVCMGGCAFADIGNDAKLQYNKGIDYYQLGQYTQAAECFRQAVNLDPNYIDAYYNLGALMEYLGNNEGALNAFKQIILRKPDDYESVYKAAEISNRIGQSEKALMYLTLIPQDSLIGQKATALANSMQADIDSAKKKAEEEAKAFAQAKEEAAQKAAQDAIEAAKSAAIEAANASEAARALNSISAVDNESDNPEKFVSSTVNYSNIASPTGLVTDSEGNLFVAGFSDNTIYKIGSDNKKIVYIKSPKIDGPIGLAIDNNGNIYIANYNKDNVLRVSKGGEISEILKDVKNPYCMHITNSYLYVSSQGNNSVIKYKLQ